MSDRDCIKITVELPHGSAGVTIRIDPVDPGFAESGSYRLQRRHAPRAEQTSPLRRPAARPQVGPAESPSADETTFRQAAERYIAANRSSWKNAKHAEQWTATLERFAYPVIGDRPVAGIDIGAVLKVLEQPIESGTFWNARAETARRVRGRIETILDWAKVRELRSGENPARWAGNLEMALPAKGPRVKHHAALPFAEVADFMAALATREGVSARALEFCILTAARTGEVLGARWSEIDLTAKVWTIPGERMKAGAEHRVPLTDRCIEILEARPQTGELVFPGPRGQLSNMALLSVLARMGRDDITVHGFRSTFRDWASEATDHPREVAEMALAHTIGNKVEAAYRRGDLFEKRRRLMDDWAAACGVSAQADPSPTEET